jgi:protein-disulfide isomerase
LKEVVKLYGKDVRLIWKDNPLPFHPRALPAAVLARRAYEQRGNAGFWRMHDALFENQSDLSEEKLAELAKAQGVPWSQVKAQLEKPSPPKKIEESVELASDFKARGTPHFFINGTRLTGAQPLESFKARIDRELAKARALLETGVPRARLYAELTKAGQEPEAPEKKVIAQRSGAASRGPLQAPVVIQQFSDFQCSFCKRVVPTLEALEREQKGAVRVVFRHLPLPFHGDAQLAAEAAEEVLAQKGPAAFWTFHDRLFEAQEEPAGLERESLSKMAGALGLDMKRFDTALNDRVHEAKVKADVEAANQAGLNGTPSFLVNDYFISGAQPLPAFRKLVKRALGDKQGVPNKKP